MRRPAAIAFATGAAVCALCAPALAQNTPAQNQAQINSIPWTNGSGKVIGAAVSNLFSAINGTFGLYAPLAGPNTWTNTNTFLGPVTLPGATGTNNGMTTTGQISVRAKGAMCNWNGSTGTDDSTAIKSAITSAAALGYGVKIDGLCYSSTAINFGNVPVFGTQPLIPTNPPQGDGIVCAASIAAPCVTEGLSTGTIAGGSIQNLMVGFAGTPIAGDKAIQIQGFNTNTFNVLSFNAYDGWYFFNGISSHNAQSFTWNIVHDHIVQDGFPEVYFTQGRFGMNGGGDQVASTAFIGVTGNDPNTLDIGDSQFNLGGQSPSYLIDFFSLTNQVNGIYNIHDSTVDMSIGSIGAFVHSDGTGTCFRCNFGPALTLLGISTPMFSMGSALAMSQSVFHDSNFFVSAFNMPGSMQYDAFYASHLYISGSVTIDGASGAIAYVDHIESGGPMVVQGSAWGLLTLADLASKTSYVDSAATGKISATNTQGVQFVPVFTFGAGALQTAVQQSSGTGGVNGTAVYSVSGGTCTTQPTLNVTWTSGALTVNSIANAGSCSAFPPSPAPLTYVSGTASGWTGATVNAATVTSSYATAYAHRMPDGTVSSSFGISLGALGSSSGSPIMYNFPYTCAGYGFGQTGLSFAYATNMSSLSGPMFVALNQNTNTVGFGQTSGTGATGVSASNFSTGSVVSATIGCSPK